ncbi:hypothetical protein GYA54_00760 [Candidatus Kuenenbacteria bacterium]|nr:hypothetical protein [Candidatus Kuenenbacteria bacterium]
MPIKRDQYEKITRELPFFLMETHLGAYKLVGRILKSPFSRVYYFAENNVCEIYRNVFQYKRIIKKIEREIKIYPKKYLTYFNKINDCEKKIQKIIDGKSLRFDHKKIKHIMIKYWAYYIICAYIGYALNKKFLEENPEYRQKIIKHKIQGIWVELGVYIFKTARSFKNINTKIINSLSLMEIQLLISNKLIDYSRAAARQTAYLYYADKNLLVIGNEAKKMAVSLGLKEKNKFNLNKNLRGAIAFPGIKNGRVKIIKNKSDFPKIKKNDILVATMTNQMFIPIIQKAAAIITDEGGATCHAAIISRELKIPCIVGTKIATKALKDGDLVEVDANKGIVRKMKN